jgi:hypothetical protein
MEENQTTVSKISIKFGLISGLLGIAFFVLLDVMGQSGNQSLSYIGYAILAAVIFFAHKAFKEEGDGFMNYGQGLGIGTLLSLVSSILSSTFFYIYVTFVSSDYITSVMDKQREKLEESGMADAQIEQAMEMTEKFMTPGMMLIFGVVGTVFFGLILSLVISAITQKKRPEQLIS